MKVVALDAALGRMGVAIVEGEQVIWLGSYKPAGLRIDRKLQDIYFKTRARIGQSHPDVVVVECPGRWARPSVRSSQHTVEVLAMVRGAIAAACGDGGVNYEEMEVADARRWFGVAGNSQKAFVHAALALHLRATGGPPFNGDGDAADAAVLGLAYCRKAHCEGLVE